MTALVQQGFSVVHREVLKQEGNGIEGVAVCSADLAQYAACHAAFKVSVLLLLGGWGECFPFCGKDLGC